MASRVMIAPENRTLKDLEVQQLTTSKAVWRRDFAGRTVIDGAIIRVCRCRQGKSASPMTSVELRGARENVVFGSLEMAVDDGYGKGAPRQGICIEGFFFANLQVTVKMYC